MPGLCLRQVHLRLGREVEAAVMDIAADAHDGAPRRLRRPTELDAAPQRLSRSEHAAHERLVDDDHPRRSVVVAGAKARPEWSGNPKAVKKRGVTLEY